MTAVNVNDDTPPAVPAPNARPNTATQKADLALDRLDELERNLAAGGAAIVHSSSVDVGPKVVELDKDLDALTNAFNALAEKVEALPAGGTGKVVAFDEDAQAAYDSLRGALDATNARLAELGNDVDTNLAGDVDRLKQDVSAIAQGSQNLTKEQGEHDKDIVHLRQENGSLCRAVEALLKRVELAEKRVGSSVPLEPRTSSAGLARPAVMRLMRKVVEIGKDSQAPVSAGGFKFRGIEAVMDAIGSAMRHEDVGLILETRVVDKEVDRSVGGGRMWTSVVLTMRYTFVHPEDGSEHSFEMVGEGRDMGDKAASKAASMAAKYGLCQALMIPFTNMADSDAEDPASQQADEEQRYHREQEERAAEARRREADARRVEDEANGRTPGAGTSQQRQQQSPPADEPPWDNGGMTPQERMAKAMDARTALNALNEVWPPERPARLDAIEKYARQIGIMDVVIDGQSIAVRIQTSRATV